VHVGKLGQGRPTNFTVVDGTAKHCDDQYIVLFRYCSLGGDTAMPGGLHARLNCHAFLVFFLLQINALMMSVLYCRCDPVVVGWTLTERPDCAHIRICRDIRCSGDNTPALRAVSTRV